MASVFRMRETDCAILSLDPSERGGELVRRLKGFGVDGEMGGRGGGIIVPFRPVLGREGRFVICLLAVMVCQSSLGLAN